MFGIWITGTSRDDVVADLDLQVAGHVIQNDDVPNTRPDAVDDEYTINDGETLILSAPGLLANDTDDD